ncbi:MAG: alcohol dehydrogenase catalytic domain-containing protein [Planctomycetales bacterium]|nr:alcohol dehydrogenase catalytic domain-containing protein [Planctomycetales bacterium]
MSMSLAAVYEGRPGQLALRELPAPELRDGEVLVEVLGCTLCGSDLHTIHGRRETGTPVVLGHEIVGRVRSSAGAVRDIAGAELRTGDRVTWSIASSCGQCFYCQRDLPQKCLTLFKYGHRSGSESAAAELRGGLAELCLLDARAAILRLPEDLSLESACPANCATATVAAALEAAAAALSPAMNDWTGRQVVVTGAGMLGLTAAAMLRWRGAEVWNIEPAAPRREWAARLGANPLTPAEAPAALARLNEGHGADAVFEMTGAPEAWQLAWPALRLGGVAVHVGAVFPTAAWPLPLEQLVRRQATLRGVHNYAPRHLLAAVEFLKHNDALMKPLVTTWLPLREANEALEAASDPVNVRVGVRPTTGNR